MGTGQILSVRNSVVDPYTFQISIHSPSQAEDTSLGTVLGGWARMATAVLNFNVVEVAKPNIGHSCPSIVRADVTVNLSTRREIREEWEGVRKHDVMFLVTVRAHHPIGNR